MGFEFNAAKDAWEGYGLTLYRVHSAQVCEGRHCIIHNPMRTHMDDWPLHWRDDRGIFERIDPLGCGHPDPSQFDFWSEIGHDWEQVHGCTGLCDEDNYAKWRSEHE